MTVYTSKQTNAGVTLKTDKAGLVLSGTQLMAFIPTNEDTPAIALDVLCMQGAPERVERFYSVEDVADNSFMSDEGLIYTAYLNLAALRLRTERKAAVKAGTAYRTKRRDELCQEIFGTINTWYEPKLTSVKEYIDRCIDTEIAEGKHL